MRKTEELLLAAKVREIAIEHSESMIKRGIAAFKREHPACKQPAIDAEYERLDQEHFWKKYVAGSIDALDQIAEVIEHKRDPQ